MCLRLLYSIGIYIANFHIKIIALFNKKLKLGVIGRKETFKKLESAIKENDRTLWFHCASLGEYEQGLPVFEVLRDRYPSHKIILSFFSPSGYEIRKNTDIADVVVYLPLDTKTNAKRFLDVVDPDYIIFVKYEIWPNFLLEIKKRNLNAILISALFRKNQSFFKWYGGMMTSSLFAFRHIFTQDKNSKTLLKSVNFNDVSIAGDTRFDRVHNQLNQNNSIDFIEEFKGDNTCVVFGSSWPDDDKLYLDFVNNEDYKNVKYIIAPHNINSNYIASLKSQLKVPTAVYSENTTSDLTDKKIFILDTIGYLSRVYSYADIAYVGGAAGSTGLHNILEPAVFGTPIIIGENYAKFPEAKSLINKNGVISVSSTNALKAALSALLNDTLLRKKQGEINKNYIKKNRGAVVQILDYIRI